MYNASKLLDWLLATGLLTLAATVWSAPQPEVFGNWPAGTSPQEIGKRVAENFLARPFGYGVTNNPKRKAIMYQEACTWYGSLTVAQLTGDKDLQSRLVKKFDPFLTPEGAKNISDEAFVDYRVFGIAPLELYIQTKDERCLKLGQGLADQQWENPTPDGITREARYWIDDMYMITTLQCRPFAPPAIENISTARRLTMVATSTSCNNPMACSTTRPTRPSSGARQWLVGRGFDRAAPFAPGPTIRSAPALSRAAAR